MTAMATRRNVLVLLYLQWRRRYAQRRLLREMGWRSYWERTVSVRQFNRSFGR
jgi:hypothetical protein